MNPSTTSPIHVALAADEHYVSHCAALLHSLCAYHDAARIHVHFLHDGRLEQEILRRLGEYAAQLDAHWVPLLVDDDKRVLFPEHEEFGQTAWYRVLLPELLPTLDRVLYLDADVIVAGPLDELWLTDLEGQAIGAVTNPFYPWMGTRFLRRMGLPSPADYFNSGVLLMNLSDWRREGYSEAILEFARRGEFMKNWPDQNGLNAVLWRRRLRLAPIWNAQSTLFDIKRNQLPFSVDETEQARRCPRLVHFSGPYKPWQYRCKHPLRHLYTSHVERTPWGGKPLEGASMLNRFLRLFPPFWGQELEARIGRSLRPKSRN